MNIVFRLLALTALSASASAEEAVTFGELEGSIVEARIIGHQVIRRDGRNISVRFQNDVTLAIGSDGKIDQAISPTADTPRGRRHGPTRRSSHTLERPGDLKGLLGGGDGVFVFTDGTLTWLRTFKGGGFKRTTTFARGAEGLTCTAIDSFARENGVGSIVLNSSIDGQQTEIVSYKPLSSTCRVKKQGQPSTKR
jgi:hypothetical protein